MKLLTLLLLLAVVGNTALAQQDYPSRPLRMIIPWPPGQATDVLGRLIGQKLSETLGKPVVADNRPGAGGVIGTELAARAPADGYTLLAASSGPISIAPLTQKLGYVVERDFAPVAKIGVSPYVLVTSASFPAANARDLIAQLKASPAKYTYASSGTGASTHLIVEWFNTIAGVQVTHIPYKGSPAAITDVISGQVTYTLETAAATMALVRAGRLKAYGISVGNPSPVTPGIEPLARGAGMTGFDIGGWIGIMLPAATPRPLIDKLTGSIDSIMRTAEARERLMALDIDVDYRPPTAFAQDLKTQLARFGEIVRKGNIRLD